jgi:hypothetical protein
MSGRSCSLASKVFFETIAVADEKTRKRGGLGPRSGHGQEFGGKLRHGDIGLLADASDQEIPMRIELGMSASAARLGRKPPTRLKRLSPD